MVARSLADSGCLGTMGKGRKERRVPVGDFAQFAFISWPIPIVSKSARRSTHFIRLAV
jgi:site-specific recombinase XerC